MTAIVESAQDGSVLRGEVLARWQEFVGTGEYLKKLETGVGRLRDRMSAAFRGEPARTEKVSEAIEGRLASMIIAQAHDAARRADPTGAPIPPAAQRSPATTLRGLPPTSPTGQLRRSAPGRTTCSTSSGPKG